MHLEFDGRNGEVPFLVSLGLPLSHWSYVDSLGLAWTLLDSLGLVWFCVVTLGHKWFDLVLLELTQLTRSPFFSHSIICSCFAHLGSFALTSHHSDWIGVSWTHLDSLGFTWSYLISLGITWSQLVSKGEREARLGRKGKGKCLAQAFGTKFHCTTRMRVCMHRRTNKMKREKIWFGVMPPTTDL